MVYKEMTPALQKLYKKRIDNCVRVAEMCPKDSWAHKYWMQVAGKLSKDLAANQYRVHKWNTLL